MEFLTIAQTAKQFGAEYVSKVNTAIVPASLDGFRVDKLKRVFPVYYLPNEPTLVKQYRRSVRAMRKAAQEAMLKLMAAGALPQGA